MAKSHSVAQAKYDSTHCKYYTLKMNLVNDSDVIDCLDQQKSKQGYIKDLIRQDMARTGSVPGSSVPTSSVPNLTMSIDELYKWLQKYADANFDGSMYDVVNALSSKVMGYEIDE